MKTVKFTASGSNTTLGSFSPGDMARNIPDDMADHLVNEVKCAVYLEAATQPAPAQAPADAPDKPARKRKAADSEPTPVSQQRPE